MRWIFENLNLLLVIAGAVAWWLNQRAREKAGERPDYDDDGVPEVPETRTAVDEANERARRIRELIAERRRAREGGPSPASPQAAPLQREPEEPPPVRGGWETGPAMPPVLAEPPPLVREVVRTGGWAPRLSDVRRTAEVLEQQAALAEQLEQAEQMKAALRRRTAHEQATRDQRSVQRQEARRILVEELRDPVALRRAFILREVLGPPVGLR